MQEKAKAFLLSFLVISSFTFVGCGGGGGGSETNSTIADSNTTPDVNTTVDLRNEFKANTFYAVKDDIQSKSLFKISFDDNLSSWNLESYDHNYSSTMLDTVTENISLTTDTLSNAAGSLQLASKEKSYIELVSTLNPLLSIKFFQSSTLAEGYYNISLKDELRAKGFFVVQNNASNRALYKIDVKDDLSQWDITNYNTSYTDPISSSYGLPITVFDSNLTDSGGNVFRFQSKETDYLSLVFMDSSTLTLKFYFSQAQALEYFNSFDLRKELRAQIFYAVSNNINGKTLFKLIFTEDLSSWNISIYDGNYTTEPSQNADANISVSENTLTDSSTILKVVSKESDYLSLISIQDSAFTFRLYKSPNLAESYFNK